ncbi:MAG: YeeE/YedE thiosulfate transporter family protein, partial [Desulfovermiculus sp.]
MSLIYGIVTGIIFGILLQKARVLRYDKQLGALRLQDMTIVKFMLTSVLVAMLGIHLLLDLGLVQLSVKNLVLGQNIIGGLLFGLGWGLLGYCPGTSMGALGEGRMDALWGILGMLLGAALHAEAYPVFKGKPFTWGSFGPVTWPEVFGIGHWPVIAVLCILVLLLFVFFERKGL